MSGQNSMIRFFAVVSFVTILSSPSVVLAEGREGDDPQVKYRQSVMSIIGTNMAAIGDIMKHRLAMPGAIANHADQMAEAAALIAPAFKQQIAAEATDAKAEIWQDWAKFEAAIADYRSAASALAEANRSGDAAATGRAVRTLGKSCGGCHKPFRKPKEESYKNR